MGHGRMRFRSTLLGVCAISLTQIRQFRVGPTAQQNVGLGSQLPKTPMTTYLSGLVLTGRVLPAKHPLPTY